MFELHYYPPAPHVCFFLQCCHSIHVLRAFNPVPPKQKSINSSNLAKENAINVDRWQRESNQKEVMYKMEKEWPPDYQALTNQSSCNG